MVAYIAKGFVGNQIHTQVLIVRGGPVGLTLAKDLAQRDIEVTLAEMRAGGEPPSVSCNHVAAKPADGYRVNFGHEWAYNQDAFGRLALRKD